VSKRATRVTSVTEFKEQQGDGSRLERGLRRLAIEEEVRQQAQHAGERNKLRTAPWIQRPTEGRGTKETEDVPWSPERTPSPA